MTALQKTGLYDLHIELGAKMVPFAGYEMPVQYPLGVMKEHLHTRSAAGLFDVSHMGQVILTPKNGDLADAALALEALVPQNILDLKEGRQRYALFTNDAGGIEDDLMVATKVGHLFLVVNAACKEADIAYLRAKLSDQCDITEITDRALLALQGPKAEAVLDALVPGTGAMRFMDVAEFDWDGVTIWVSRSGYTGEDGYEISVPNDKAAAFARNLLSDENVEPIGLGARDSLRLEAGLCLYGSDLDKTTSPIEADLIWAIQKARKPGGDREGGFPGASRILDELANGATRKRVGVLPEGRAPMRAGTQLFAQDEGGDPIGEVTSGGFGPSVEGPVSMGYVSTTHADADTAIFAEIRGKRQPARIVTMPFRAAGYKR